MSRPPAAPTPSDNPFHGPYIDEIAGRVASAIDVAPEVVRRLVELPRDLAFGDFAIPCFALAKAKKRPPQEIAASAAAALAGGVYVASAKAEGPFVNILISQSARAKRLLESIHEKGASFGLPPIGAGKRIVVDYSSPNIAKPFHVGHLRSTVIGSALVRIFRALGYETVGVNHLGDWGTQFGNLIAAAQRPDWVREAADAETDPIRRLYRLYVRIHEEMAREPALAEEGRAWFARLEKKDPEAIGLWKRFVDQSLEYFQRIYARLGITFDTYTGESFFDDKMAPVIERAKAMGVAEESQGALVIHVGEKIPPLMLLKKDGATTYHTRDLAAAIYRFERYGFEQNLYVVDAGQSLHFQQVFTALGRMGYEWSGRCHHVSFGKILGLSTRKGVVVWLEDVLDEAVSRANAKAKENPELVEDAEATADKVGIGAVIFHDFLARRIKDLEFSWERVLNFDGESGPYVQFSHVRACGILRKAGIQASAGVDFGLLSEPEDRTLMILLESWPKSVLAAGLEHEPSLVARFLLDLSGAFHSWLHQHRVLGVDPDLSKARLLLVDAIRRILAGGLDLLGVAAPEKM